MRVCGRMEEWKSRRVEEWGSKSSGFEINKIRRISRCKMPDCSQIQNSTTRNFTFWLRIFATTIENNANYKY